MNYRALITTPQIFTILDIKHRTIMVPGTGAIIAHLKKHSVVFQTRRFKLFSLSIRAISLDYSQERQLATCRAPTPDLYRFL
ncbi:MAG: hypothetical protein H7335_08205 [Massilia sp.]|nr:hypothetical protein [Massilia sp.]